MSTDHTSTSPGQAPLTRAIALVGLTRIARDCGVSHQAVRKWERAGRLPRTEWTGETNYASRIQLLAGGEVTREQLLQLSGMSGA